MDDDRRDILRRITEWLLADEQSVTQTLELRCDRMERAIREEFGGQRVQIWRTMSGKVGRPPRVEAPQNRSGAEAREVLYRALRK